MMTDKYSSLTLPSDYCQMESLIKINKIKLMEQVVSSICYAVENNLNAIEVFNFKDSDFIVVLDRNSFESNLNSIYDLFLVFYFLYYIELFYLYFSVFSRLYRRALSNPSCTHSSQIMPM
jgi:hypothetical protein